MSRNGNKNRNGHTLAFPDLPLGVADGVAGTAFALVRISVGVLIELWVECSVVLFRDLFVVLMADFSLDFLARRSADTPSSRSRAHHHHPSPSRGESNRPRNAYLVARLPRVASHIGVVLPAVELSVSFRPGAAKRWNERILSTATKLLSACGIALKGLSSLLKYSSFGMMREQPKSRMAFAERVDNGTPTETRQWWHVNKGLATGMVEGGATRPLAVCHGSRSCARRASVVIHHIASDRVGVPTVLNETRTCLNGHQKHNSGMRLVPGDKQW